MPHTKTVTKSGRDEALMLKTPVLGTQRCGVRFAVAGATFDTTRYMLNHNLPLRSYCAWCTCFTLLLAY